jgi:Ca2+-binding RTX toxin-like protein
VIFGGAGANRILAGGGNDNINGGAGADQIDGGAGFDFASYYTAASGVTVSLADSARGTGDAAGDVLAGIEGLVGSAHADALDGDDQNNVLIGGDGGDTLAGGGGADILIGGEGSDVLIGGAGIDRLEGGAGADFFTFLSPADGPDVVADFAAGDFILVDDAAFGGFAPGFLDAGGFVEGFAPTQARAQFVYATMNGEGFLFFDADGTGAAAGLVHVATFAGAPALAAQDIFIF